MVLQKKKIGVISLGCDKNRVDTEKMLAIAGSFAEITNDITKAQIIIINTCAFLESSRKESVETIFDCNRYRKEGCLEKLVVTGCLPQKYIGDIFDELKEVDVFLGFLDYARLKEALLIAYEGNRVNFVGKEKSFKALDRVITTPLHYAYLKIADGCNNHCTYCLIPSIRGRYVSESEEDILKEAENFGEIKEVILVAQDITRYGEDLYGEPKLVELLRKISALPNIGKIRLLYCYPDMMTDELIEEIATNCKILKYVDIPLQHADNGILKRMNRKGSREEYLALINKLKARIPDIAIRSTFITGFPGETEEAFEHLKSFLSEAKLINAGFFPYSREEGTPAYKLPDQIDEKIKQKRLKELYRVQRIIARKINGSFVGKVIEVLSDGIDYDKQSFVGRSYFQAPDIDGKVYFKSENLIEQGKIYKVKITKSDDYDLYGEEE